MKITIEIRCVLINAPIFATQLSTMKIKVSILALLWATLSIGQADYQFVSSGENFAKAYQHFAKDELNAGISYLQKIHPSDTLYDAAQYSLANFYITKGYYEDALKEANNIIANNSEFVVSAHAFKIEALTELKRFEEAYTAVEIAKKAYPYYSKINVLQAKTLVKEGKVDEGKKHLQKHIEKIPNDPGAHFTLATIMADEGARAEAIFGFQMAAMVNLESNFLSESYKAIEDIGANNYEIKRDSDFNKLFKNLNNMFQSKLALNAGYTPAVNLGYKLDKLSDLLVQQFSYKAGTNDFTMNYYGKFFSEVKKKNLEEAYVLYLMSAINAPEVQKAVKAQKNKVKEFEKFLTKHINDIVQKNKFPIDGKVDERDYVNNGYGNFYATGNKNEDGDEIGKWTFYNTNGKISAQTEYNDEGKLNGECKWYAFDGYLKETGVYKDGKLEGTAYFTNKGSGTANYEGNFEDNKLNGPVKIYGDNGILTYIKTFKDNKLDGPLEEFYASGATYSTVNIVDGKHDGNWLTLFQNGDTLRIKPFTKGDPDGTYEEYHSNGKLSIIGEYKKGKKVGTWKEYYYTGKPAYIYSYKNGDLDSKYYHFSANGDTSITATYVTGNLTGLYKNYGANNRVLWERFYKKAKLKKYINYDTNGVVITKGKKNYQLNDRYGYKYIVATMKGNDFNGLHQTFWKNGTVKTEKNYKKGTLEGWVTSYYKWGDVDDKLYYKNGNAHGKYSSYYANGTLYCEGYYYNGEKIGQWKYFHANGNLQKEYYYSDGKAIGNVTEYGVNGEKQHNYYYAGGILYRTETYDENGKRIQTIITPQGKGEYNMKSVGGHKYYKTTLNGGEYDKTKAFYFPNGQLLETLNVQNGTKNGEFKSYYANGTLREKGTYVYGAKEGEWLKYHHNGQLAIKRTFVDDEVRDSSIEYYITGEISDINYYDGRGELMSSKTFHRSGEMNCDVPYDENFTNGIFINYDALGEPAIKRNFVGGEVVEYSYIKDGKWVTPIKIGKNTKVSTYYNNGKVSSKYTMKYGLYEGSYERFHSNGKQWVKANYIHDKRHKLYQAFDVNGQLRFEGNYDTGRLNGKLKKYSKSGQLLLEESYVQGNKHGICKYYNNKGKLLYTLTYNNDVVVKVD